MEISQYRRIIETDYPELRIRDLALNQAGWSSLVLELNAEYIFRFPRRPHGYPGLQKEIVLLPHLARTLPVNVPEFEFLHPPSEDGSQPYAGYRKISGRPFDSGMAAMPDIARQLGEILSRLHTQALPWTIHRYLPLRSIFDWKRQYLDLYQRVRLQVLPLLEPALQVKTIALWEGFLRPRAHFRFDLRLIHADLAPEHILCDPASARVTGIIDWEDACTGDPALDFVGLLQAGGRPFVERVLACYSPELGVNFWSRLDFYTKIVPFYEILFGLEAGGEHHTRTGLAELQRNLKDGSQQPNH